MKQDQEQPYADILNRILVELTRYHCVRGARVPLILGKLPSVYMKVSA